MELFYSVTACVHVCSVGRKCPWYPGSSGFQIWPRPSGPHLPAHSAGTLYTIHNYTSTYSVYVALFSSLVLLPLTTFSTNRVGNQPRTGTERSCLNSLAKLGKMTDRERLPPRSVLTILCQLTACVHNNTVGKAVVTIAVTVHVHCE